MFCEKGFLINFAKFTGKHLCRSLIFNKVVCLLKKKTPTQVFSCNFCEIFRKTLFYKTPLVAGSDIFGVLNVYKSEDSSSLKITFILLCRSSPPEVFYNNACNFIKKKLQHRSFPVNIEKFLRTPLLKNIYELLLLSMVAFH